LKLPSTTPSLAACVRSLSPTAAMVSRIRRSSRDLPTPGLTLEDKMQIYRGYPPLTYLACTEAISSQVEVTCSVAKRATCMNWRETGLVMVWIFHPHIVVHHGSHCGRIAVAGADELCMQDPRSCGSILFRPHHSYFTCLRRMP
jgi:hypothetical protein